MTHVRRGKSRFAACMCAFFIALMTVALCAMPAHANEHDERAGTLIRSSARTPIVFIGVGGLTSRDISAEHTPRIMDFLERADVANIVVRSVGEASCPLSGWLTVGAGRRAGDAITQCRIIPEPEKTGGYAFSSSLWKSLTDANNDRNFDAHLGALGDLLASYHISHVAIGAGAALGLAQNDGTVAGQYIPLSSLPDSFAEDRRSEDASQDTAAHAYRRVASHANMVMVDLGAVRATDSPLVKRESGKPAASDDPLSKLKSAFSPLSTPDAHVFEQLEYLDARFAALWQAIATTTPNATIILSSISDQNTAAARLGLYAQAAASSFIPAQEEDETDGHSETATAEGTQKSTESHAQGFAYSTSTRHFGLVQLTDIAPTLASLLNISPSSDSSSVSSSASAQEPPFIGAPISLTSSSSNPLERIQADARRAEAVRPMIGPFYVVLFAGSGLFVCGVLVRKARNRHHAQENSALPTRSRVQLAYVIASLPAASLLANLLPWWRAENTMMSLGGAVLVCAAIIASLASYVTFTLKESSRYTAPIEWYFAGPTLLWAIGTLVLCLDVILDPLMSSYPLQLASLMGTQPQVGGRFYGLSNATFTVWLVGYLALALAIFARCQRTRSRLVALICVLACGVAIDGLPFLGADFGGPPAAVMGVLIGACLLWKIPLNIIRLAGILLVCFATSIGVAFFDFLRPPANRTHLGAFIQSVIDGNGFDVIARKISLLFFGLPAWVGLVILACLIVIVMICAFVMRSRSMPSICSHAQERRADTPHFLMRFRQWKKNQPELIYVHMWAVVSSMIIAMLVNDSGIVMPAVAGAMCVPVWMVTDACSPRATHLQEI